MIFKPFKAYILDPRDASTISDFHPDIRETTRLMNPYNDDGQLTSKHHYCLENISPDHCLQPTLPGGATCKNKDLKTKQPVNMKLHL